jgi:hypothetical protein
MTFVDQNRFVYQRDIGLSDKDRVDIYIGDYLEAVVENDEVVRGLVSFAEEMSSYVIFCFENDKWYMLGNDICDRIKVVGNVFDSK